MEEQIMVITNKVISQCGGIDFNASSNQTKSNRKTPNRKTVVKMENK